MPSEHWGSNQSYFQAVAEQYQAYGYLAIDVYPRQNSSGKMLHHDTRKWGLVPTEPLTVPPFTEKTNVLQYPGWHGVQETPMSLRKTPRYFANATGSWDFYYLPDGGTRSPWDSEGILTERGFDRPELEGEWLNRHYTWTAVCHQIMGALQGQKCRVFINGPECVMGTGNKDDSGLDGKLWLSKVSTEDNNQSGHLVLTISYDLEPGGDYI